jgi:hypothetical protein
VKAEAAVADEPHAAVEAFQAAVGEAEADRGEDAVAVAAQGAGGLDEGRQAAAAGPGQPGVEVRGRERGVLEVVEQPQLVVEQEGAVQALGALVDLAEGAELVQVLAVGCLQQRPARVFDPAAGRGVRALMGVPFVAADLVDGVGADPDDVEGVKTDLGVRGTAWRSARWSSPLMSIETPRMLARRPPSSSKKACRVALVRPLATHTIRPDSWSATTVR